MPHRTHSVEPSLLLKSHFGHRIHDYRSTLYDRVLETEMYRGAIYIEASSIRHKASNVFFTIAENALWLHLENEQCEQEVNAWIHVIFNDCIFCSSSRFRWFRPAPRQLHRKRSPPSPRKRRLR